MPGLKYKFKYCAVQPDAYTLKMFDHYNLSYEECDEWYKWYHLSSANDLSVFDSILKNMNNCICLGRFDPYYFVLDEMHKMLVYMLVPFCKCRFY